jgi:hypothetical protein
MGIRTNYDTIPTNTGVTTPLGVFDLTNPLGVNNPCGVCDPIIQDEIICELNDAWNNNLCANDFCFNQPIVPGDCMYFQFQFQNTRNGRRAVPVLPNQPIINIPYGWYHYSLNPTNFTIRARLFNACTNQEFTISTPTVHNYADDIIQQATVFLDLDRDASSRTLPNMAYYRWVQNINMCLPATLPANFPKQFYFMFTITPNTGSPFSIFSQTYEIVRCEGTIQLEGIYSTKDCFGYSYSNPSFWANIDNVSGNNFGQQVLTYNNLIANLKNLDGAQYRNLHRFYGNAEQTGHFIEKEIPERQCNAIKTKTYPVFRIRLKPAPPYVAEIFNNNISGNLGWLTGVGDKPSIRVQPQSGADKNNDNSKMWIIDTELKGCDCLDYQQC